MNLEKLKTEHPDLYKEVFSMGAKSVTLESFAEETKAIEQKGFDAGKAEGVKAERSRCVELMNAGGEPQATKEAIEQGTELQAAYKYFFEAQKKAMAEQAEKGFKEKPANEREAELAAVAAAHGSPATAAGVEKAKEGETFEAKVAEFVAKGMSKKDAMAEVTEKFPGLHDEYLKRHSNKK